MRHCATGQKVPGSIPGGVLSNLQMNYSFCPHSFATDSTQRLTEMSTKVFTWGKEWRADSSVVLIKPEIELRSLSGKYLVILNISTTGRVVLM